MRDLVDDAIFDGSTPIPQALEQLRLRLLDLTGRNRLLNFKHTAGKSLPLVPTNLDGTFQRLVGGQTGKVTILSVPDPMRDDWVERNGRMAKPEAKEYAIRRGLNVQMEELPESRAKPDATLALYYDEDLGKHCRKLDREARLAIEETGANMLYLVLGFLEFPDNKDSTRTFAAPLICVPEGPVRCVRSLRAGAHAVFLGGDDITKSAQACIIVRRCSSRSVRW